MNIVEVKREECMSTVMDVTDDKTEMVCVSSQSVEVRTSPKTEGMNIVGASNPKVNSLPENVDNSAQTFDAIKAFVEDLNAVFGTSGGKTPLDLYYRLIKHVESGGQKVGVDKYIVGFKTFFSNFDEAISTFEGFAKLPRDTFIRYGDSPKVYLEIQKYIFKSKNNKEQLDIMHKHLLTISLTIHPDEKKLNALGTVNPILERMGLGGNSAESRLVQDIFNKAKKAVENSDSSDPQQVITSLMTSGVMPELFGKLGKGISDGSLNGKTLLPLMTGSLTKIMTEMGDNEDGQLDVNSIFSGVQGALQTGDFGPFAEGSQVVEVTEISEDVS